MKFINVGELARDAVETQVAIPGKLVVSTPPPKDETISSMNKQRESTIPDNIVTSSWKSVQANIGKFQNLFKGPNFIIIDNNNVKENLFKKVHKEVMGLLRTPLKNYKAKNWIKSELGKKKK